MLTPAHEREYLKLAAMWLACRLDAMGGKPLLPWATGDIMVALLGCRDYAAEMSLVLAEARSCSVRDV